MTGIGLCSGCPCAAPVVAPVLSSGTQQLQNLLGCLEMPRSLFGLSAVGQGIPQELGLHPTHSWEVSTIHQKGPEKEAITQLLALAGWFANKTRIHTSM